MNSTKKMVIDENELDDVTFTMSENQNELHENKKSESVKKYTKIDGLDNDKEILGHKNVIVSMISPENILNCGTWGIKVKGF